MLKKLLFSLYLILWAGLSWAQIAVSSSVDKTSLTLDDEITLTVTVQGAVSPLTMPQLPSFACVLMFIRAKLTKQPLTEKAPRYFAM